MGRSAFRPPRSAAESRPLRGVREGSGGQVGPLLATTHDVRRPPEEDDWTTGWMGAVDRAVGMIRPPLASPVDESFRPARRLGPREQINDPSAG